MRENPRDPAVIYRRQQFPRWSETSPPPRLIRDQPLPALDPRMRPVALAVVIGVILGVLLGIFLPLLARAESNLHWQARQDAAQYRRVLIQWACHGSTPPRHCRRW